MLKSKRQWKKQAQIKGNDIYIGEKTELETEKVISRDKIRVKNKADELWEPF